MSTEVAVKILKDLFNELIHVTQFYSALYFYWFCLECSNAVQKKQRYAGKKKKLGLAIAVKHLVIFKVHKIEKRISCAPTCN